MKTSQTFEKDKKEFMKQLKSNFKFIGGVGNTHIIKDMKGALENKEWRLESNITKEIIKPTEKIANCQKVLDNLAFTNN